MARIAIFPYFLWYTYVTGIDLTKEMTDVGVTGLTVVVPVVGVPGTDHKQKCLT